MTERNISLLIEYDGTAFAGWQIQPNKRTVQQTIQDVLCKITGEKIKLVGASRTDTGAHALGQVANFTTHSTIKHARLLSALNGLLPPDIAIKKIEDVELSFHAIRRAKKKKYIYLIWNSKVRSPFLENRAWHVWDDLDLKAMKSAAQFLIGHHDFAAFRAAKSDTLTSMRTIFKIEFSKNYLQKDLINIEITADGFLKYMVRNLMGTLVDIGKGIVAPEKMKTILESKDRKKAGRTAPACGLYLVAIDY